MEVTVIEKISYIKYVEGHKDSKGEDAPWCIFSHETGKLLASFKTKKEAEEHLKRMKMFKEMKGFFETHIQKFATVSTDIIQAEHDLFKKLIDKEILTVNDLTRLIVEDPQLFEEIRKVAVRFVEGEITEEQFESEVLDVLEGVLKLKND
jgi:CRISPR/Cas system CMR-associated protein Cmr5 small subunit